MLSSFSIIKLPSEPEKLTLKPLILPELLINELNSEDVMRFFGYQDDDNYNYLYGNDYYCGAVLKLSKSISVSFESSINYVLKLFTLLHIKIVQLYIFCFSRFTFNLNQNRLFG